MMVIRERVFVTTYKNIVARVAYSLIIIVTTMGGLHLNMLSKEKSFQF